MSYRGVHVALDFQPVFRGWDLVIADLVYRIERSADIDHVWDRVNQVDGLNGPVWPGCDRQLIGWAPVAEKDALTAELATSPRHKKNPGQGVQQGVYRNMITLPIRPGERIAVRV